MAGPYYLRSTDGSDASDGLSWANAFATLAQALATAAAGEIVYVSQAHAETPVVNQTYTVAAGVTIKCVNDGAEPPTTLATGGSVDASGTSGVTIAFAGAGFRMYGMTIKCGGSTGAANLRPFYSSAGMTYLENCTFEIPNTNTAGRMSMGAPGIGGAVCITRGCTFIWGNASQGFTLQQQWYSIGDDWVGGATVPTTLFPVIAENPALFAWGCDLSDVSGTLFESAPNSDFNAWLWACKLNASVTVWSPTNSKGEVYLFDCAAGDVHYALQHWTHEGSTVAGNSIYPTGGAKFDGTNPVSWTVDGSNADASAPYFSPWIDVYHAGTSAITPYLEAVRDGSATKYNDDEVWSEWMVKATAGEVRASMHSERTLHGTANALASSALGASDWTGEGATAAFMKLQPDSSFTPAELGAIRARIGVSGNHTIIVDPFVRGLS